MKYIPKSEQDESNENKELASIPFTYDFSSGVIRSEFAEVVMAPARIEPRINKIDMSKNILKEKGLVELSKILIFNKYIKIIDFHTEAIKTIYLDFLNQGFGIFDIIGDGNARRLKFSIGGSHVIDYTDIILSCFGFGNQHDWANSTHVNL